MGAPIMVSHWALGSAAPCRREHLPLDSGLLLRYKKCQQMNLLQQPES